MAKQKSVKLNYKKKTKKKLPIEHVRYVERYYYRQTIKDHLVIVLVIYDRVVMHSKQIVD